MYRIDNSTAAAAMPAIGVPGVQVDAWFTDGDPATATPSTILPAEWLNSMQGELCNYVEDAGLTLDKGDLNQLKLATDYYAQKNEAIYYATSSAANSYVVTLDPAPVAYTEGMGLIVKFTHANSNSVVTVNVNTLGAKSVKRYDGTALAIGDIADNSICHLVYDGTQFLMLNSVLSLFNNYAASTSPANTYAATLSDATTTYTAGLFLLIKFSNHNTSAATININGLGAKALVKRDGTALVGNEIKDGMVGALVYDGVSFQLTNFDILLTPPEYTTYTTGTGTYTTPTGAIALRVKIIGGGGGGGNGHPSVPSQTTATAGGNTTFGAFTATGGGGGSQCTARGSGGAASGGNISNIYGGDGQGGWSVFAGSLGGSGGNSTLGGAGTSIQGNAGGHAQANTGAGGSGGGGSSPIPNSGSGGGAGGTVEFYINTPAATYSYGVGAGGAGSAAGGGTAGGNGAAGIIMVQAIFQ